MAEKTEAPSPRKLHEAKLRGNFARSVELNAAVALMAGAWMIQGPGKQLARALGEVFIDVFKQLPNVDISDVWLRQFVFRDVSAILLPIGEIVLGMMVIGIAVTLLQIGFTWASKRKFVDFSRVNPVNGFKRIFSLNGLFDLVKALLKLVIVGWVVYGFLRSSAPGLLTLSGMELQAGVSTWFNFATGLMWRVAGAYFVLALIDYLYQRWEFMRNMRMTKQEVLDEIKQSEGDPFMRQRIRQQQRAMMRMRMMSNVPKADVIITNPIHLAVAVQYKADEMNAPRVLAKGSRLIAEKIVSKARECHIPVVQNVTLARSVYKVVNIEQEIPPELYMAMAEILAYVYRLRNNTAAEKTWSK